MRGSQAGGMGGAAIGTAIGGPVGGSIGQALGSMVGGLFDSDGTAELNKMYDDMIAEEIELQGRRPEEAREIVWEKLKAEGVPEPLLEKTMMEAPSRVAGIKEDPRLKQAQMAVLQQYQAMGKRGMTPELQAQQQQMLLQQAAQTQARAQQETQALQQRGLAGGGAELAARLQAGSAGAAQAAEQGMQMQALASKAALEGLGRQADLSGTMSSQQFERDRLRAAAADEIARRNVEMSRGVQQRNIGSQNLSAQQRATAAFEANKYNLAGQRQERLRQLTGSVSDYQRAQADLARKRGLQLDKYGQGRSLQAAADQSSGQLAEGVTKILGDKGVASSIQGFFNKPAYQAPKTASAYLNQTPEQAGAHFFDMPDPDMDFDK